MNVLEYENKLNAVISMAPLECGVQSLIYKLLDETIHSEDVKLLDVSNFGIKSIFGSLERGTPDLCVVQSDFKYVEAEDDENWNKEKGKRLCCIEIKATSEKLPTKITQIAAHIQEYKKVLYTNGLVWIYFDNSIELTHETIEKVLPWKLLKAIKSSNCSEVEFTQTWNRLKEEAGLQWIIPLVFSTQDGMEVMLSTVNIDDTISREPVKINKEKYDELIIKLKNIQLEK